MEVDFNAAGDFEVKPLSGVNKGVLTFPKYGLAEDVPSEICDLTTLYQAIGITSVRTHDDVFDVANVLRGEGSFSRGVVFRGDVVLPADPDFSTDLEDYLADPDLDGYIFSVAILNTFMSQYNPSFPSFEEYDAWLYWYPQILAPEDPNNYAYDDATTGVRSSYDALAKGGFEIYFRVGESFNGPTYMGPQIGVGHPDDLLSSRERYATVAARILEHLITTHDPEAPVQAPPGFIEVWNEPGTIGYHGPDAKWDPPPDHWGTWIADFRNMANLVRDAVGHVAPTGGFGFNRAQLKAFVNSVAIGNHSKSYDLLSGVALSTLPFLSFHWYKDLDDPLPSSHDTLPDEAMKFADDLLALHEAILEFARNHGVAAPPLHITEWNFLAEENPTVDFPRRGIWGAFVSAGLTWMQHPRLNIQRAHFWDGHVNLGLIEVNGVLHEPIDNGVGVFSVRETFGGIEFIAHASAFSMAMHKGLDGDAWIPLTIEGTEDPLGVPVPTLVDDVLEAATSRFEVTAMATFAEDEQRHTIILTNLASSERAVTLSLEGLVPDPLGQYRIRTRSLDIGSFPTDGAAVQGCQGGVGVVPEIGQFENYMDTYIVETVEIVETMNVGGHIEELVIEVPAFGVVRVDIKPAAAPEVEIPGDHEVVPP